MLERSRSLYGQKIRNTCAQCQPAPPRSRAGRLGCAHHALRLLALGWAAVLLALIWKFAWIDFLTIRVSGCACSLHGASDR